ncbi:hypothetical protein HK096_005606 [Nowakowskiella sp. JEL0078]|nr:hypothetical protein HK096_005606 [Nowakowskiella sp. JEL0078]
MKVNNTSPYSQSQLSFLLSVEEIYTEKLATHWEKLQLLREKQQFLATTENSTIRQLQQQIVTVAYPYHYNPSNQVVVSSNGALQPNNYQSFQHNTTLSPHTVISIPNSNLPIIQASNQSFKPSRQLDTNFQPKQNLIPIRPNLQLMYAAQSQQSPNQQYYINQPVQQQPILDYVPSSLNSQTSRNRQQTIRTSGNAQRQSNFPTLEHPATKKTIPFPNSILYSNSIHQTPGMTFCVTSSVFDRVKNPVTSARFSILLTVFSLLDNSKIHLWPELVTNVNINGNRVYLNRKARKLLNTGQYQISGEDHPVDISMKCFEGNNTVSFDLNFISNHKNKSYGFEILFVSLLDGNDVWERVIREQTLSSKVGEKFVVDFFKTDDDDIIIEENFLKLDLRDPCSMVRCLNPVKTKGCNHLQAFDFYGYLQTHPNHLKSKCPICASCARASELVYDCFVASLLKECPESANEVYFLRDGTKTWELELKKSLKPEEVQCDSGEEEFQLKVKPEIIDLNAVIDIDASKSLNRNSNTNISDILATELTENANIQATTVMLQTSSDLNLTRATSEVTSSIGMNESEISDKVNQIVDLSESLTRASTEVTNSIEMNESEIVEKVSQIVDFSESLTRASTEVTNSIEMTESEITGKVNQIVDLSESSTSASTEVTSLIEMNDSEITEKVDHIVDLSENLTCVATESRNSIEITEKVNQIVDLSESSTRAATEVTNSIEMNENEITGKFNQIIDLSENLEQNGNQIVDLSEVPEKFNKVVYFEEEMKLDKNLHEDRIERVELKEFEDEVSANVENKNGKLDSVADETILVTIPCDPVFEKNMTSDDVAMDIQSELSQIAPKITELSGQIMSELDVRELLRDNMDTDDVDETEDMDIETETETRSEIENLEEIRDTVIETSPSHSIPIENIVQSDFTLSIDTENTHNDIVDVESKEIYLNDTQTAELETREILQNIEFSVRVNPTPNTDSSNVKISTINTDCPLETPTQHDNFNPALSPVNMANHPIQPENPDALKTRKRNLLSNNPWGKITSYGEFKRQRREQLLMKSVSTEQQEAIQSMDEIFINKNIQKSSDGAILLNDVDTYQNSNLITNEANVIQNEEIISTEEVHADSRSIEPQIDIEVTVNEPIISQNGKLLSIEVHDQVLQKNKPKFQTWGGGKYFRITDYIANEAASLEVPTRRSKQKK